MQNIFISYATILNNAVIVNENCFNKSVINNVNKYKNEKNRIESKLAYFVLNNLLITKTGGGLVENKLTFSSNGKPLISAGNVGLSHSYPVAMAGYSTLPFGVDVELIRDCNNYKNVAKKLGLNENCSSEEFFLSWTKVESALKLTGKFSTNSNEKLFYKSGVIEVDGIKFAYTISSFCDFNVIFC